MLDGNGWLILFFFFFFLFCRMCALIQPANCHCSGASLQLISPGHEPHLRGADGRDDRHDNPHSTHMETWRKSVSRTCTSLHCLRVCLISVGRRFDAANMIFAFNFSFSAYSRSPCALLLLPRPYQETFIQSWRAWRCPGSTRRRRAMSARALLTCRTLQTL